ncbi:hypothetical protein SETIT_2G003900v2 [Setaria italica]|uniref:Uncharacterized protein n=1 Tax=Setaria italica TaxID=4555 RepID=A0A368PU53_SETIT|nr:hypothetical protein SETIT_2G003900v2 [Setaria italica]
MHITTIGEIVVLMLSFLLRNSFFLREAYICLYGLSVLRRQYFGTFSIEDYFFGPFSLFFWKNYPWAYLSPSCPGLVNGRERLGIGWTSDPAYVVSLLQSCAISNYDSYTIYSTSDSCAISRSKH